MEHNLLAVIPQTSNVDIIVGRAPGGGYTAWDLERAWLDAWDLFLASRKSENTRRAYTKAWQILLAWTERAPWEIDKTDLFAWVDEMRQSKLSDATIQQRVAAISSFYQYALEEYEVTKADGSKGPLFNRNPAASKSLRPTVEAFSGVSALRGDQVNALLRAIPLSTVQGLRDFTLFIFYLSTGRRNSEIRTLQKKDFRQAGEMMQYCWRGKRKDGWDEVTPDVWEAMQIYLEAAGRPWDKLSDDGYIFTALTDSAKYFRGLKKMNPYAQPLSMRQVGALLKKYARRAGLDASKIHVHVLRHTTATLMDEAGFGLRDIQARLAHASLDMTSRYMDRIKGQKNTYWVAVKALHNLPDNPIKQTSPAKKRTRRMIVNK